MDGSITTVLVVLAGAVVLFLSNRIRPDLAAILVLIALVVAGSVTTEEALAGFGSTAVVTVAREQDAPDRLVRLYGLADYLWEVRVEPEAAVIGQPLNQIGIGRKYGLSILSVVRAQGPHHIQKGELRLEDDDILLLGGRQSRVLQLCAEIPGLYLKGHPRAQEPFPSSHAELIEVSVPPRSTALQKTVRDLHLREATGLTAIALWAALLGAVGMIFLGALSLKQAYESIDWRVIVLIAGMLPLGTALQKSGAAELVSDLIVTGLAPLGARGVLLAMAGLALLLTQVVHNAAVAVIVAPIALDAAASLQSSPKAFGVAVIIGASAAFLLPVGHPALLLVQEPGQYRTRDYLQYGAGLVVITGFVIGATKFGVIPIQSDSLYSRPDCGNRNWRSATVGVSDEQRSSHREPVHLGLCRQPARDRGCPIRTDWCIDTRNPEAFETISPVQ